MDWARMKTLMLVIEVLSPSTARYDRFTKRRLYQEVEIPAYWVVNADDRSVEVWTPEDEFPRVEQRRVEWRVPGGEEPFVVELEDLFRPL